MNKQSLRRLMMKCMNDIYWRGFYHNAIPILCYHSIPDRESFQIHMSCIREFGLSVTALDDLVNWMRYQIPLRMPAIALTFDDCYASQLLNAVPVLAAFGYPATFFAVTQWIRQRSNPLSKIEAQNSTLRRSGLLELRRLGFEIGFHGRTHTAMSELAPQLQEAELQIGKRELEDLLGKEVHFFSYPYGHCPSSAVEAVKACGFQAAVTVRLGGVKAKDDLFTLKRICVPVESTREGLKAQLTWIPQLAEMVRTSPPLDRLAGVVWRRR